jgi:hypothetical protein
MTPRGCPPESAICPQPFHVLGSNRCWNGDFEFFDRTRFVYHILTLKGSKKFNVFY